MFLKEIKPKIKINKNDLYKWNINSVNYKEKEKQQIKQAPFLSNEQWNGDMCWKTKIITDNWGCDLLIINI